MQGDTWFDFDDLPLVGTDADAWRIEASISGRCYLDEAGAIESIMLSGSQNGGPLSLVSIVPEDGDLYRLIDRSIRVARAGTIAEVREHMQRSYGERHRETAGCRRYHASIN